MKFNQILLGHKVLDYEVLHQSSKALSYCCSWSYRPEKAMAPTPVLLPGKSHGRRSLVGCSPWGLKQWDMTERLHFHFSLSCIGEGTGNPLQCSCLENPRDGGAWWAAVYGVTHSRTQLKWLSSSSRSCRQTSRLWRKCEISEKVLVSSTPFLF